MGEGKKKKSLIIWTHSQWDTVFNRSRKEEKTSMPYFKNYRLFVLSQHKPVKIRITIEELTNE